MKGGSGMVSARCSNRAQTEKLGPKIIRDASYLTRTSHASVMFSSQSMGRNAWSSISAVKLLRSMGGVSGSLQISNRHCPLS